MTRQDARHRTIYGRFSSPSTNRALGWIAFLLLITEAILSVALITTKEEPVSLLLTAAVVFAFLLAITAMTFLILRSGSDTWRHNGKEQHELDTKVEIDEIRDLEKRLSSEVADLRRCLLQCGSLSAHADAIIAILVESVKEISKNRPIGEVNDSIDLSISLKTAIAVISNATKSIVALPRIHSNGVEGESSMGGDIGFENTTRQEIEINLADTPVQGIDTMNHGGKCGCPR